MINMILVDDHRAVAEGTKALLEQDGRFFVHICSDESGIYGIMETTNIDILLIDLYMPGLNGVELSKRILDNFPHARIIIYTGFDLGQHFNLIVETQVSGFISKSASREQIVNAIEAALRDEVVIPIQLFRQLRRGPMVSAVPKEGKLSDINLTKREVYILMAISEGRTNKEIAQQLNYSQRTIEYSITNLFDKLQVKSRTEALSKARKYQLLPIVHIDD
ncbi:response regulator transcription factor [Bacillus xiapuensis]|uniref:response regulator transcription factor n=1 Tax=Bacillus xiapuensis TaxID=2014075 RepID=UPI000C23B396|nr:response regulator transcription factor [Bacillus xiapuensis]